MIISVDPGLANYGFSCWHKGEPIEVGVIKTKKPKNYRGKISEDLGRRCKEVSSALHELIIKIKPDLVVGEMPGFGAKSSSAAVAMTMASSITITLCNIHNLETIWHTPREIKEYFTGNPHASKQEMMIAACKHHGWSITYKQVKDKKASGGYRTDSIYWPLSKAMPGGKFEHVADSIGAYHTARHYCQQEKSCNATNAKKTYS